MKGDKLPMGSISPTFFVPVFSFSKKHRRELEAHDAPACVMSALEEKVAYWKGLYTAGLAPRPGTEREALRELQATFEACASTLEKTDQSTLSALNAVALPKTRVSIQELHALISEYRVAAQKGADRKVSPGPDASKDTSIAIGVGATLKECGIVPDAKPKGIFVISTAIVFEVMDIHKSEARNAVRRALKSLQQSAIGKLI